MEADVLLWRPLKGNSGKEKKTKKMFHDNYIMMHLKMEDGH